MDLDGESNVSFTYKSYTVETQRILDKTKMLNTRVNHAVIVMFGAGERDCVVDIHEHDDLWNELELIKSFDIANPTFTVDALVKYIVKHTKRKKTYNATDVISALTLRKWVDDH